jgi:hypothetical protein
MNANTTTQKNNPRLRHIRTISRILKVLIPLYFIFGGFRFILPLFHKMPDGYYVACGTYATISQAPLPAKLLVVACAGLLLLAVITCYQLLSLYEKGVVFSAKNVQLLGRSGYIALGYGLLTVWGPTILIEWESYLRGWPTHLLFLRLCSIFSSPWILGGLFVAVVAHIMDQGRQIQEEQELTV